MSDDKDTYEAFVQANIDAELSSIAEQIREEIMMSAPWRTGNLAGSVRVYVDSGGIVVEMVYYGRFVDQGTIFIIPRNFVDPILDKYVDQVYGAYNRVTVKYINGITGGPGREVGEITPTTVDYLEATMEINELARATRMSMILLSQMGLPKDIEDKVRQIQMLTMMIVEITRAIRLFNAAVQMSNPYLYPLAIMNVAMAGATAFRLGGSG